MRVPCAARSTPPGASRHPPLGGGKIQKLRRLSGFCVMFYFRADLRVPGSPQERGQFAFGRSRARVEQIGFVEDKRILDLQFGQVAAQEEAERRAFGGQAERIGVQIEVVHPPAGVLHAGAVVAPRETPHPVPALERAESARHDAAAAAEAPGRATLAKPRPFGLQVRRGRQTARCRRRGGAVRSRRDAQCGRFPSFMSRTQRPNRADEDTVGTAIRIIADSRQNHLEGRSPAFANVD